jgi:hypothetical protein
MPPIVVASLAKVGSIVAQVGLVGIAGIPIGIGNVDPLGMRMHGDRARHDRTGQRCPLHYTGRHHHTGHGRLIGLRMAASGNSGSEKGSEDDIAHCALQGWQGAIIGPAATRAP